MIYLFIYLFSSWTQILYFSLISYFITTLLWKKKKITKIKLNNDSIIEKIN